MSTDFGKCFLCSKPCEADDPDVTQVRGGRDGFAHISCIQEAAESLVDTERECEIGRSA
jgi:hypothetical protein